MTCRDLTWRRINLNLFVFFLQACSKFFPDLIPLLRDLSWSDLTWFDQVRPDQTRFDLIWLSWLNLFISCLTWFNFMINSNLSVFLWILSKFFIERLIPCPVPLCTIDHLILLLTWLPDLIWPDLTYPDLTRLDLTDLIWPKLPRLDWIRFGQLKFVWIFEIPFKISPRSDKL